MRRLVAVLALGLMMGCGGTEGEKAGAPNAGEEKAEVTALACSDCHPLYVRCMSRAKTPEARADCEESRLLCEETFCSSAAPGAGAQQVQ